MLTKKNSKSNVVKSCAMENFFKVLIIFSRVAANQEKSNLRACSTLITSRSWLQLELLQKNRWIWCKAYAIYVLSIAQRIHQLMPNFSGLTRYPKKPKTSDQYKSLKGISCPMLINFFIFFATIINKESHMKLYRDHVFSVRPFRRE